MYFWQGYEQSKVAFVSRHIVRVDLDRELSLEDQAEYFDYIAMEFDIFMIKVLEGPDLNALVEQDGFSRDYDVSPFNTLKEALAARNEDMEFLQAEGYTVYSVDYRYNAAEGVIASHLNPLSSLDYIPYTKGAIAKNAPQKLGRVTVWTRANVGNISVYIDGQYIGAVTVYLSSGDVDCYNPYAGFPTMELQPGTHTLRAVVEATGTSWTDTFTVNANTCYKQELSPPPQPYYNDSGYYEEDDEAWDIILYIVTIGSFLYLISLI